MMTLLNSGARMDHKYLKNSSGKPSGPGDLLLGLSLRALGSSFYAIGNDML